MNLRSQKGPDRQRLRPSRWLTVIQPLGLLLLVMVAYAPLPERWFIGRFGFNLSLSMTCLICIVVGLHRSNDDWMRIIIGFTAAVGISLGFGMYAAWDASLFVMSSDLTRDPWVAGEIRGIESIAYFLPLFFAARWWFKYVSQTA